MRTRLVSTFTILALLLLCVTNYANPPVMTMMPDEAEPGQHRIIWSTAPGIRYELQESSDVAAPGSWTSVAGYPTEAEALAQQAFVELDAPDRKFYRVRMLDEQAPQVTAQYPRPDDFAMGRFSTLQVQLEDVSGIDPGSIIWTVGGHGPFSITDPELTFEDGTLSLSLGGDTALGAWGETIEASLSVSDNAGNDLLHEWSFNLEVEAEVVADLFVFGSPQAQRAGQEVGPIPARVLATRMAPGPIRMNADADPWTLENIEPDRLVIHYTGALPPVFGIDTHVCNLTPVTLDDIFYRRILWIEHDPAAKTLTLLTEEVGLEELIQRGSLTMDRDAVVFEADAAGILAQPASFDPSVTLDPIGFDLAGDTLHNDARLKLEAKQLHFWLTPALSTSLEFDGWRVKQFHCVVQGDLSTAIELDLEIKLADYTQSWTNYTYETSVRRVVVGTIGPVPVFANIWGEFELTSEIDAKAVLKASAGAEARANVEFGLDYHRERSPAIDWICSFPMSASLLPFSLDVEGELSFKLNINPAINVAVYGMAGKKATPILSGGLEFATDTTEIVNGHFVADLTVKLEPAGRIFNWLDPTPNISRQLWERKWKLFPEFIVEIDPPEQTVMLASPFEMHAVALEYEDISFTWYKDGFLVGMGQEFLIENAQLIHTGSYHVVASVGGETATSAVAIVSATLSQIELTGFPESQPLIVAAGHTLQRNLGIHNRGLEPLTVTGITYPPGFSGAWSGTIQPGESAVVTVTFAPDIVGTFPGLIEVQSNAETGEPRTAVLGLGEEPVADIQLVGIMTFGEVPVEQSRRRVLRVINAGNVPAMLNGVAVPDGFSTSFESAVTINPGSERGINIFFTPTEETEYSGQLTVQTTPGPESHSVEVSGTGVEPELPAPAGMVVIPGGTNSGTDPDFGEYSLTVSSFHMDRYPVTKALWDEVYAWAITNGYSFDNAGSGKAANHPVHTVNWYDAVKWCNARSEKEGRPAVYTSLGGVVYRTGRRGGVPSSAAGYRLPTDVEWEYAARGGFSGRRFPWGDSINHNHANYIANGSYFSYDTSPYTTSTYHPTYNDGNMPYTSPVGSFAANGYGLYDMSGNVWEWVFDWHPSFVGRRRVLRGGGWFNHANGCRVRHRRYEEPNYTNYYYSPGFRAVLPLGQ